jgi:micrococcal nuclease
MDRRTLRIAPLAALLPLIAAAAFAAQPAPLASPDREAARFALCEGAHRVTCVVDGDTFWYRGDKIRIADINAPEVSKPSCEREAELGNRATGRLLALLNSGPFTLAPNDDGTGRDSDRYGRLLRTVTRDGASLGGELVSEGLAEHWKGYRGNWC